MRSVSLTISLIALGSALGACSGRTTRDSEGASGTSNSGGSAGSAGSVSVGGVGGTIGAGGTQSSAGSGGSIEPPLGCGFEPQGPAADEGDLAPPEVVWERISLFLEDVIPFPPELPPVTTPAWAGDYAMGVLDAYELSTQPGLTRFFENWMPELEDPSLWAGLAGNKAATLRDLLLFSPSSPGGPPLGILTDHGFLTTKTNIATRGTWMAEHLFCTMIPAPPPDIPPIVSSPSMTRREEYVAILDSPACAGCHVIFDPLGFSLEHYDAMGSYSDVDDGLPIDSSGSYTTPDGMALNFTSISDLAPALVTCEVARCFSLYMFQYALGRAGMPPLEFGNSADSNRVANRFGDADFDMRTLVRAIVESPAFLRP